MFHLKRQISIKCEYKKKRERILFFYESVVLAMKTGYNNILQSVESDKEVLDNEWKDINWNSIKYGIFKIQKRIFEAEKEGYFFL